MRFAKYHGLGNDFIIVDRRAGGEPLSAEAVERLCERHRGIGADGVLTLWRDANADARMQVQNADGSDSNMCGNGLRCVARYLLEAGGVQKSELVVSTGAGRYRVERVADARYRVAMGRAVFRHAELPPDVNERAEASLSVGGEHFVATCVHLGNPHAVLFVPEGEAHRLAERLGKALATHPYFARGANISFVEPRPRGFFAVVYERGSGITQACGSGACAVVAAAVKSGRSRAGETREVELLGGPLSIIVDEQYDITMEGDAVRVYEGEVAIA